MDMDVAATVLAGSILTGLAFIVVVITIVVVNNIFHRYWQPVKWIRFDDAPSRFMSEEEMLQKQEPTGDVISSTTTSATVVLQQK